MNDFDLLNSALQYHIVNSLGWDDLRSFQKAVIRPILDGGNNLILAPTAGGKTEAALFPVLSRMLDEDWKRLSVIYICPIKALLNNLDIRLGRYLNLLGRRSACWHGDISTSRRKRILRDPPDCLLTTPESLEVILTSRSTDHETFLAGLRVVIVDEIHAFAGDDRGWHLLAVLERVSRFAEVGIQRIGLSATVGNPDELAKWFKGGKKKSCAVHDFSKDAADDADVTIDYVGSIENAAMVISRLHRGHKRLIFVESRSKAEKLSVSLRQFDVDTYITHSSLSVGQRKLAEKAFAEKEDCVIVATSVLELGIDVGDLDYVIQVDAPRTVGSFLQRMGRTGRRPGTCRNYLFLATSTHALLQAGALIRLWEQGYTEPLMPPMLPFHVVCQQLMALALQESGIGINDWQKWIGAFCEIAGCEKVYIDELINHMLAEDLFWNDNGILWFGQKGEREFGYRNFMEILSIIAGEQLFTVKHGSNDIGFVHPSTFFSPQGDQTTILLSGKSWKVRHVDWNKKYAYVEAVKAVGRSRWIGSGVSIGYDLCQSIHELLCDDKVSPRWSRRTTQQFADIRDSNTWFELGHTVFVINGNETRWWTFAGDKVNRTLVLLLKEQHNLGARSDSISIVIKCVLQLSDVELILSNLKDSCHLFNESGFKDEPLIEFKFFKYLPRSLRLQMVRSRLTDTNILEKTITLPFRIISSIPANDI